jgi:glycosyltransferase involved in cell wall biosynthesis
MPITRHAVLLCAYNQNHQQHDLTVQALESALTQDIGNLEILLIDNGSTIQETYDHFQMVRDLYWSQEEATRIHICRNKQNLSPVGVANRALDYLWQRGHDKVLSLANDVYLPPNAYRLMNEWPRGLVCASQTADMNFLRVTETHAVSECTPMAMAIIRKWFCDALIAKDGYFLDENYFHYASDIDMALRMAACGIRGIQLDLPYYHYGSAHWRMLPPEEGRKETDKADADRAYFKKKWGHEVTDPEYGRRCGDINFRAKAVGA